MLLLNKSFVLNNYLFLLNGHIIDAGYLISKLKYVLVLILKLLSEQFSLILKLLCLLRQVSHLVLHLLQLVFKVSILFL
jgi:hypothetical protein